MKRRTLLASMGVGMASITGCFGSDSEGDEEELGPESSPGTPVAIKTPEGTAPDFSLESINATATTGVGQPYNFEVTVKNTGDQGAVYRAPVTVRFGDDVDYEQLATVLLFVEGGETATATVELPAFESTGVADIRVAGPNNTWSIDIESAKLPIGQSIQLDRMDVAITNIEFGPLEDCTATRNDTKQVVVTVRNENNSRNQREDGLWQEGYTLHYQSPSGERFQMNNCSNFRREVLSQQDDPIEFKIAFTVPADATLDELFLKASARATDRSAFWSTKYGISGSQDGSSSEQTASDA